MESEISELLGATDILTVIFETLESASERTENHVNLNLTVTQFDALNNAVSLISQRAKAVDAAHNLELEAA